MRTKVLLLAVLLLMVKHLEAQKFPKFGSVSKDIVKMTTYPADSSASAVIIADYGTSNITYFQTRGWIIEFKRYRIVKVLTKEGYSWADVAVPIYVGGSREEAVQGLKGTTYNLENGQVVEYKLDKKSTFKEEFNDNYELVKFTMPNVKEGSVIEYTYEVQSPYLFNLPDWQFEHSVPVVHSEYSAKIPEYFDYKTISKGYIPLKSERNYETNGVTISSSPSSGGTSDRVTFKETVYKWSVDSVSAFVEEPFITTTKNYKSAIQLELATISYPGRPVEKVMGSWPELNKSYLESTSFGVVVDRSSFLKKELDGLNLTELGEMEKIEIIVDHLKEKVVWNGGYGRYASNLKNPYEEGKGSSAQINLTLVSMLKKAGFDADPVLISTRDNGFVNTSFALSAQFNYVIAAVDLGDQTLLLDATDRIIPFHMLPERCLNGKGWRVSETKSGFVDLDPVESSKTIVFGSFSLNLDEEKFDGTLSKKFFGYEAHRQRTSLDENGIESYQESETEEFVGDVSDFKTESFDDLVKPCKEEFTLAYDAEFDGDYVYLDPLMNEKLEENLFKIETRSYPVDFAYPYERQIMFQYSIPEGMIVEEVPEGQMIALENRDAEFMYNVSQNGQTLMVVSKLKINKPIFTPAEYPNLKEFFALVVEKQNEMIVLKNE